MYIRPARITGKIQELKDYFKQHLYQFAQRFHLEALIIENAITIPVNLPLGLAITEFIAETGYPVIAHHHDFHWERQRFMNNSVHDYLARGLPPQLALHSACCDQFRAGVSARIQVWHSRYGNSQRYGL